MQIRTNRLIRKNILSAGLFYYVLSFLSDNSDRVRHVFFPFFQEVVPLLVAVVSKRFVVTTERYLIIQFVGLCFYYISVVVLICGFFAYNIFLRYAYAESDCFTLVPYAIFCRDRPIRTPTAPQAFFVRVFS